MTLPHARAAALLLAGLAPLPVGQPPIAAHAVRAPAPAPVEVLAAGDVARCGAPGAEATAALLDRVPGTVLMLGDAAYPSGTAEEFARCYAPTWGRHRARTLPVPGNHEYRTEGADGYFGYFGAAAHRERGGYYSVDRGGWHLIALNSNIALGRLSPQLRWLRRDLAASRARCTLAFWHHPRFSSGEHGDQPRSRHVWALLQAHDVELVLGAHDHDYERFAPQRADGAHDERAGIRQFVVGTGGAPLRPFVEVHENSEVRVAEHVGVLSLSLDPDGYRWRYLAAPSGAVLDSGGGRCR